MTKKNWVFTSISCAIALVGASGCGLLQMPDKMDDMKQQLVQTQKQMEDMKNQTHTDMGAMKDQTHSDMSDMKNQTHTDMGDMKDKTHEDVSTTNQTSGSLYQDLRQGNSWTLRRDALQQMEADPSPESKISEAGSYMMAFEFQLFKDVTRDTPAMLEVLKFEAVQQFFRDITRYGVKYHSINMKSPSANDLNLSAIAATLHQVNPNANLKNQMENRPDLCLLSIIEDTLKRKPEINRGATQTMTEHELLLNEGDAVYMLQLRANFLAGMVLERLTGIQEEGFLSKAKKLLGHYTISLEDSLEEDTGLAQLQNYTTWINESNRVRDELVSLGYDTRIDGTLLTLFNHMNLVTTRVDTNSNPETRTHAQAEAELIRGINSFRGFRN